jgi:hypothetical protein
MSPRIELEPMPAAQRANLGAKLLLVAAVLFMGGLVAMLAALLSR